ncbi:hypothetical protein L195_g055335, partial [Trifolium pratense]
IQADGGVMSDSGPPNHHVSLSSPVDVPLRAGKLLLLRILTLLVRSCVGCLSFGGLLLFPSGCGGLVRIWRFGVVFGVAVVSFVWSGRGGEWRFLVVLVFEDLW